MCENCDNSHLTVPADIEVRNEGSLFLFDPLNARASEHLDEIMAGNEEAMFFCGALVVEARCARSFAAALRADGFILR